MEAHLCRRPLCKFSKTCMFTGGGEMLLSYRFPSQMMVIRTFKTIFAWSEQKINKKDEKNVVLGKWHQKKKKSQVCHAGSLLSDIEFNRATPWVSRPPLTFDGDRAGHPWLCQEDRAPTSAQAPGGHSACSDNWKEFSTAPVKSPAKATWTALTKNLLQVSVVSVQKKTNVVGGGNDLCRALSIQVFSHLLLVWLPGKTLPPAPGQNIKCLSAADLSRTQDYGRQESENTQLQNGKGAGVRY